VDISDTVGFFIGVKAIWDLIKGTEDKREPFSCFVARFYKQNGRPLRVAIDGYQWLVESSAGIPQGLSYEALISKSVQGFHRKVRYMISLNVSFVIVFDGCYKPKFKRSKISIKEVEKMRDIDYDLHYFDIMQILENYKCDSHDKQEVKHIKQMLKLWNIDYVEASGEGKQNVQDSKVWALSIMSYQMTVIPYHSVLRRF
jgi:Holliday junction resolvase YEN1